MINTIAKAGKPVIVLLVGGSAVTMQNWVNNVASIACVWYGGEEAGNSIADVLLGNYNPAGRLPITFPLHEGQLPLVSNHKPTGRGDDYNNLSGYPQFPFGYGLLYQFTAIFFSKNNIKTTDTATFNITVKNSGKKDGDEVVQRYIKDLLSSVTRPVMELKGFERIHLKAGESKRIQFSITPELLTMLNANLQPVIEAGQFRIMIGASSRYKIRNIDGSIIYIYYCCFSKRSS
jgi:beta-glucosidase